MVTVFYQAGRGVIDGLPILVKLNETNGGKMKHGQFVQGLNGIFELRKSWIVCSAVVNSLDVSDDAPE